MQISISASCSIELIKSESLSWESNRKDAFSVRERDGYLEIKQISGGSGTTVISTSGGGFSSISSGSGSVVIGDKVYGSFIQTSGGDVYINGKRMDAPSDGAKPAELPWLNIYAPNGTDLDLDFSGSADAYGNLELQNLDISTSGSSKVDLAAKNVNASTSGSSTIKIKLLGGKASFRTSGSSKIDVS
jgi:hypothetical protein